jgi:hypothetical protein
MNQADELVRRKLSDVIGRSGRTHEEVAIALTALLGQGEKRAIRKVDVDEFCRCPPPGESRGKKFPAYLVGALCEALGNDELARSLLPERLQKVVAVGELAIKSHGTLARALSELEKIVAASAGRPAAGKRGLRREK